MTSTVSPTGRVMGPRPESPSDSPKRSEARATALLRFLVKQEEHLRFLEVDDIEWVRREGHHVVIHAGPHQHPVRHTLNEIEEQLGRRRFARISRSVVVNLRRVQHLVPWFGGGYIVQLVSGTRLKLTRPYAEELFQRLGRPL